MGLHRRWIEAAGLLMILGFLVTQIALNAMPWSVVPNPRVCQPLSRVQDQRTKGEGSRRVMTSTEVDLLLYNRVLAPRTRMTLPHSIPSSGLGLRLSNAL